MVVAMSKRSNATTANGNGGGKWLRPVRRLAIYLRDSFTCLWCGRDLHDADPFAITLDHKRCRTAGERADHRNSNVFLSCRSCNSRRGNNNVAWMAFRLAIESLKKANLPVEIESVKARAKIITDRINRQTRRSITRHLKLAKSLIEQKQKVRHVNVSNNEGES